MCIQVCNIKYDVSTIFQLLQFISQVDPNTWTSTQALMPRNLIFSWKHINIISTIIHHYLNLLCSTSEGTGWQIFPESSRTPLLKSGYFYKQEIKENDTYAYPLDHQPVIYCKAYESGSAYEWQHANFGKRHGKN